MDTWRQRLARLTEALSRRRARAERRHLADLLLRGDDRLLKDVDIDRERAKRLLKLWRWR